MFSKIAYYHYFIHIRYCTKRNYTSMHAFDLLQELLPGGSSLPLEDICVDLVVLSDLGNGLGVIVTAGNVDAGLGHGEDWHCRIVRFCILCRNGK